MVAPIPDNVTELLGQLSTSQQVTLRTYIASLRAEVKELEDQIRTLKDPDPHAHYHGHEKCTADHDHKGHDHKEHDHKEHDHKAHDHKAHDHKAHDHKEHDHKEHHHDEHCHHEHKEHAHNDHKEHAHAHDHHEDHPHDEVMAVDDHHDHKEHHHEHAHEHKHAHDEKSKEETIPAWKKLALESGAAADPLAAPFGGDWKTETSVSATEAKMEE